VPEVENKLVDTLSCRVCFLKQLSAKVVVGFERFKDENESCPDFKEIVCVKKRGES